MSGRTSPFHVFIERPVMTTMANLALLVFGVLGLLRLPVRELPNIDPPVVNVLSVYPGASAAVVETEVTERLEEAISSCEGIKRLSSESREQVSSITVEFVTGRDIDLASQDVRDRVSRVRGSLPRDLEEPVISKQDASAQPFMWIALFGESHNTAQLTEIAERRLKERLQTIAGVSSVILGGEKRYAMRLLLDPMRMAAHKVTVLDVQRALDGQNVDLPGGRLENQERELTIEVRGALIEPADFMQLALRREGNRIVRLSDVGRAEHGVADERSIARYNGKPAVGLGVVRQSKANVIAVANGIKAELQRLAPYLPPGVQTFIAYDESIYVDSAVREVWETLLIAFALVVLTIFLFLRNPRSTLIPVLSIPVSVLSTFGFLHFLGFSINIFTLLALVLAIGIVVDDAIVVLENVYRHIEEGLSPLQAARKTMGEISFAIMAITFSLVAVFLPLAFLQGITGKLLTEFAVALAVSVLVSAGVALTLAPMVASRLLKPIHHVRHGALFLWFERLFDALTRRYLSLLGTVMRRRFTLVVVALLAMGVSTYFYLRLEREFLPEENKNGLLCIALAPVGSTAEYTDRMARQMEEIIAETPGVEGFFSAVALPFNGPGDATLAFLFLRLREGQRPHVRDIVNGPRGLSARFFTEVEGAFAFAIMPKAVDLTFGQPFQLVIQQQDLAELDRYAQKLAFDLRSLGFLANVRSTFEINKPQLEITVDRDRAAVMEVSPLDIARTLQILFGGLNLSQVKKDGKEYDVLAQLERGDRMTAADVARLNVADAQGALVPLSNLVQLQESAAPNAIQRHNRLRSATLEATPLGVPLGSAIARTESYLAENLPPGFSYEWSGEADTFKESGRQILFFLILAIVVVYMVLAAQFESLIHPFTVMLALPLAGLGAFGALWLLGHFDHFVQGMQMAAAAPDASSLVRWAGANLPRLPSMNLNMFSQVGLVLLVGLVTKNSILLVEFANQNRASGKSAVEAMMEAGRIRLRPILMTSLATIAGILPIAIGFGDAAESRRPLGVVAVGGMLTSTLLTLFVIPVVYTLLADLGDRLQRRRQKAEPLPADPREEGAH